MEKLKKLIQQCDLTDAYIDPYIKVALMPWHIEQQTPHVDDYDKDKDGDTVTWNDEVMLEVPDDPAKQQSCILVVQVWDEDVGIDDLCGQGIVQVDEMAKVVANPDTTHVISCELSDHADENAGIVNLEVTFRAHKESGGRSSSQWTGRRADLDAEAVRALEQSMSAKDKERRRSIQIVQHAFGTWTEGGPIIGHLDVKVVSATGLENPSRQITDVNDDHSLMRKGLAVVLLYFGTGAAVYNRTCTYDDGTHWSFVDTIYFGMVTITTTGYGDLLPNHVNCDNGTMLFACIYVFVGVGIIASALGFMVGKMLQIRATGGLLEVPVVMHKPRNNFERLQAAAMNLHRDLNPVYYATKAIPKKFRIAFKSFCYWVITKVVVLLYFTHSDAHPYEAVGVDCTATSFAHNFDCDALNETQLVTPDPTQCAIASEGACNSFVLCDLDNFGQNCSNYCSEDNGAYEPCIDNVLSHYLSGLDAVYMISVSLTSVGYGDFSPTGQNARLFTIFWLFIGVQFTAKAWGSFAELFLKYQQEKLNKKNLNMNFDSKSIMKLDDDASGEVNEIEFVAHMLVKTNIVDQMQLTDIRLKFKELDKSGDGFITGEDLMAEEERQQEQLELENQSVNMTPVTPLGS